jgi:Fe-S cluster biosynthesis and repair protein YggX
MTRMVHCVKLGQEAEGLDRQPYPGELGKRIYAQISKQVWQQWLKHQTMLINEMRLVPVDPKARKFLEAEMEKFLFGQGSAKPEGYVAPKE